jgi:exopolyphosphatase/guanosine-5'-triphosphate,3'-diphosphate pyrophosphatase
MSDVLRISVADLGSNTLKILHAVRHEDGHIESIQHNTNTLRLGTGIETTGIIEQPRMDACIEFLREQESVGRQLGSDVFIGVATEALRVARNGEELQRRIRQETGWDIELISGTREAELTFAGLRDRVPGGMPVAIVDIGGGSTEVIAIEHDVVVWQKSIPIGSGRLADRYFESDPPGMEATALAFAAALEQLGPLEGFPVDVHTMLFSGGNGVFLAQLSGQLFPNENLNLHTVERVLQHLSTTPADDAVRRLGIALPRAQVLPAGVAIALAAFTKTRADGAIGVPSGIQLGLIATYGERAGSH